MNMKNKKALCFDLGIFTEQCVRLVRDCAEVKYYCPWADAFPELIKSQVGEGLDGMERVRYFWEHVDNADFIYFPDTTCKDIVEFLKKHDYPVAGAGAGERIEHDRWYTRTLQKEVGLPVQETKKIIGVRSLKEFLETNNEQYVKIDTFRGISESFKHLDWKSSESRIDQIAWKLGPYKEDIVFICEKIVKGVEPGWDGIVWEGETVYPAMVGYEQKGVGIIERTINNEEEAPEALKLLNQGLSAEFKKNKTRFFYSLEAIINKNRWPFLIDPTIRMAGPGTSAIQTELFENFSEVVYGLAVGEKIPPKISYKYSAAISLHSEEANKNWLNISFPKELRQWIKFRSAIKKGNNYYAIPGFDSVCIVIGMGNTISEAVEQVRKRVEVIEAVGLDKNTSDFDDIQKNINEGKKLGINF